MTNESTTMNDETRNHEGLVLVMTDWLSRGDVPGSVFDAARLHLAHDGWRQASCHRYSIDSPHATVWRWVTIVINTSC